MFVFFGLVATVGSAYVQLERIDVRSRWPPRCRSVCWAVALLVINNLRDRIGDTAAGKRTLAVRLGDGATRWFFIALPDASAGP